jgi:hypothetical protein
LLAHLNKDRSKLLNFSTLTPGSRGTTVIHEAARRKDIELLRLCASRGASMVVRDRKGKMALDVAKDEQIKQLLKQGANSEGRALQTTTHMSAKSPSMASLSLSPSAGRNVPSDQLAHSQMKGYLSKWTNMARGYRTRFFVLHDGHISYYRDAEEQGRASRGTISMSVAQVEFSSSSYTGSAPSGSDKTTFVISTKLGKSPRWFLKANHPVEALQWVNALQTQIEVAKQLEKQTGPFTGLGMEARVPSADSSLTSLNLLSSPDGVSGSAESRKPTSMLSSSASSGRSGIPQTHVTAATPSTEKPSMPPLLRANTAGTTGSGMTDDRLSLYDDPFTRTPSPQGTDGSVYGDETAEQGYARKGPPHSDNFE